MTQKPIFERPLKVPKKGDKVYKLTNKEINDILRIRGMRTELYPGMGGVSPRVIADLLQTSSELPAVDLVLTYDCNFKCVHCYRPREEWGKVLLSFDVVSKVIEQSLDLGVRFFVLTGGEPLMYKSKGKDGKTYDYFDVVDKIYKVYAKSRTSVDVLTFSDVATIDKEKARMLAERKVALCLKRDSLNHELQDEIVGVKGASKDMEKGYQNLFEAGYGKNPNLAVSVNHVLRKGKFDTLKGAIDLHMWIRSHGMEHSIVPIHYCGEALNENQEEGIHPLEVKVLYDIISMIDAIEFNDPWKVYSAYPKNKTCNRPGRGVNIRSTGKVTSCSECPLTDSYIFGNVNTENFNDIIRSKKFKDFQEEVSERKGKYTCNPNVCDLNKNHLCRSGCATRSAFSKVNTKTGLIMQNTKLEAYSRGREDPLCPGWVVLAQKQGVLKQGLYEEIADKLLKHSKISPELASKIKKKIIQDFNALRKL